MPRFVVLEHDHPFLHWDFMLEDGDALRTWRLLCVPKSQDIIAAEQLADHRIAYLDYEGPVSKNRGAVRRWDRGDFVWEQQSDGRYLLRLQGTQLVGNAQLVRVDGENWEFEFRKASA